jgi:hypothetical protein
METKVCLDISNVLFHTVPKFFQAHVVTYKEIFQALALVVYGLFGMKLRASGLMVR